MNLVFNMFDNSTLSAPNRHLILITFCISNRIQAKKILNVLKYSHFENFLVQRYWGNNIFFFSIFEVRNQFSQPIDA